MSRRALLAVSLVGIVVAVLWLRSYFAPEQVIRRSLLGAVGAFEREELLPLMTTIDRSYQDSWGQSYESLAGVFRTLFEEFEALEVTLEQPRITVSGEHAELALQFIVWGSADGTRGYVVGSVSEPCTATIGWTHRTQGWRIVTTAKLDIPELRSELGAARTGS